MATGLVGFPVRCLVEWLTDSLSVAFDLDTVKLLMNLFVSVSFSQTDGSGADDACQDTDRSGDIGFKEVSVIPGSGGQLSPYVLSGTLSSSPAFGDTSRCVR
jgi:hypothetical protein